jgi:hypothetical protein
MGVVAEPGLNGLLVADDTFDCRRFRELGLAAFGGITEVEGGEESSLRGAKFSTMFSLGGDEDALPLLLFSRLLRLLLLRLLMEQLPEPKLHKLDWLLFGVCCFAGGSSSEPVLGAGLSRREGHAVSGALGGTSAIGVPLSGRGLAIGYRQNSTTIK